MPDFDTGEIHESRNNRSNKGLPDFHGEGMYGGDQVRCKTAGGCLISKHLRRFAASEEGSVTCQISPWGLDHCAHYIWSTSARMLRHGSPQACSTMRSPNKARTLKAT